MIVALSIVAGLLALAGVTLLICAPMLMVAAADARAERCPRCHGRGSRVGHFSAYCERCQTTHTVNR